ncbi:MAG: hypothetical protein COV79_03885 [Parcubacteria group bacterium CG11_big_fil_rev_8_21_14_0_20_41_14]|nr:MAG: hypothetical protein COV79_03885 [Parcubacteria group bacterium CG11_big_fil_rev_8_21_14_0_20_41_14]
MSFKNAVFWIILISIIIFGILYVFDPIIRAWVQPTLTKKKDVELGMEFGKRFWTAAIFVVVWGLIGLLYAEIIGKKLPKWSTPISFSITFILTLLIFLAICG